MTKEERQMDMHRKNYYAGIPVMSLMSIIKQKQDEIGKLAEDLYWAKVHLRPFEKELARRKKAAVAKENT